MKLSYRTLLLLFVFMNTGVSFSTDYHIGPGQAFTTIGAFTWSELTAGDNVYIHAKPNNTPYYEHLYLSAALQGTSNSPINIIGVNDSNGNQPILDATNSTTGTNFDAYGSGEYHSQMGIVVFGPSSSAGWDSAPQYVNLQNLRLQNYINVTTTDEQGIVRTEWSGAGIYIQGGQHIVLDKLTITGCQNGMFGKDYSSPVRWITLRNSYVYANGIVGSYLFHNLYNEVKYLTLEFNHFGPPLAGNNIKDRGPGTVIRYNFIEDGGHLLDLVECQDNCEDHTGDPTWVQTFVYGNILYAGPNGPGYLVHFGTGGGGVERTGTLYFYNNTTIVVRNQSSSWYVVTFQLSSSNETVDYRNNISYVVSETDGQPAPEIYLQYDGPGDCHACGNMSIGVNWVSPGWYLTHPSYSVTGVVTGQGNIIPASGNTPGFLDFDSGDYHLVKGSACIGASGALPSLIASGNALGLDLTPKFHYGGSARNSLADLGAYEYIRPPTPRSLVIPATFLLLLP